MWMLWIIYSKNFRLKVNENANTPSLHQQTWGKVSILCTVDLCNKTPEFSDIQKKFVLPKYFC